MCHDTIRWEHVVAADAVHSETRNEEHMKFYTCIRAAVLLTTISVVIAFGSSCKSTPPTCGNQSDIAPNGDCWFGDCRLENAKALYPNPVQRGGIVKLDMTCGGATRNMQFVQTSVHVDVCNILGQHVSSFTVGPFPPNSNIQQIPIWNVNVAAGTYLVTVSGDITPCGSKVLLKNVQLIVQ